MLITRASRDPASHVSQLVTEINTHPTKARAGPKPALAESGAKTAIPEFKEDSARQADRLLAHFIPESAASSGPARAVRGTDTKHTKRIMQKLIFRKPPFLK
jgi:hypothetical protein